MLTDAEMVMGKVAQTFDSLNIGYWVGGSIASGIHGEVRFTNDVDFIADIKDKDVVELVATLKEEFYVDDEMIRDAIQTQSSFNVVHLPTMVKVDVFLMQSSAWAKEEWRRRRAERIGSDDEAFILYVASPEDMILQKLNWFRLGGGVSDRQWRDVQGILKVQAEALDTVYLRRWAAELDLLTLLQQACDDARIDLLP